MLADVEEVMGGAVWRNECESCGRCHGNATDMILISKLMGHANRFTTLENYTNTLGWISRYFEAASIQIDCIKIKVVRWPLSS